MPKISDSVKQFFIFLHNFMIFMGEDAMNFMWCMAFQH
jgi:hypothetical protein